MKETWKKIKDYENYSVSDMGNVRRDVGGKGLCKDGRILKPRFNTKGYGKVLLSQEGKTHNGFLHRLVSIAFIPNPNNLEQVNHKNGIKSDNRVENLEWVSPSENVKHSLKNGLQPTKYSEIEILEVINLRNSGLTQQKISDLTGIERRYVGAILKGKSWSELTGIKKEKEEYVKR